MKRQLHFFPILLTLLCCFSIQEAFATHNRAGEITYRIIDGLTIEATITTYTKASSVAADRDTLEICWDVGGPCEKVGRSNGGGQGQILANDTKLNKYIAIHTYPGIAHYVISMTDPNRNGGILNVNWPNSENVPFYLETTVTFYNPNFEGPNNSPILAQAPIDIACVNQVFIHNPTAFDPDGDSLSYELITPFQGYQDNVPFYEFPNEVNESLDDDHILNPVTGTFIWDSPKETGEYNIAMYIIQHRDGVPIDTMIRDMQILVVSCDNMPPVIETIDEVCVIAGETLSFDVTATAPISESSQQVDIQAFGAPLDFSFSPAVFNVASGYQPQPLIGTFEWETKCEHIADQYYSVTFRTADNFPIISSGDTLYLSTLKTVRIKVVGPPPQDLQAEPGSGMVDISWELPYECDDVMDDYFQGFNVWRKEGSNAIPLDECNPGLEGQGYTLLNPLFPIKDIQDNRYYFLDEEVERGKTYCYRVEARFARLSAGNFPFNWVSSLPSDSVCVQLSRDIPLITNVTVETTGTTDGKITVAWSKPIAEDLDTLQNPGPYIYKLYRANGIRPADADFQLIPDAVFTSIDFAGANDTMYLDSMLNTADQAYSYKVEFFSNEVDPGEFTIPASSVFLSIASTDNINNLSWDFEVPWNNSKYTIFRENAAGVFDSIGVSNEPAYSDTGLINGKEYCYKIQSTGSYGIVNIINPIFNDSQEACGIPLDTIPPCPPELEVTNICDEIGAIGGVNCETSDNLTNSLNWKNPIDICETTDDVVSYNIYYTQFEGGDFELIETIPLSTITEYEHFPDFGIAGCYAITAVDTFFNESELSNIVCKDNCPIYNLPNVFTPNNDGMNDLYTPFPYCFIEAIELQVFNRWGNLVFETSNPEIEWDGKNLKGEDVAEGVYFYTCKVFEQRVSGIVRSTEILQGSIQIIRGNN